MNIEAVIAREPILNDAFIKVQNAEHWKLPICAWVEPEALAVTVEAIVFYVGGSVQVEVASGKFRVTSPGYYANIGA